MPKGIGKEFEEQFKKDWLRIFPKSFIYRLPDQQSMYKQTSKNPCDFLTFVDGKLFLIECKTHKGASIPFSAITQFDILSSYQGIDGLHAGVIVWLYEKEDCIVYIPIETLVQMKNDGEKSFGVRHMEDSIYEYIKIPSAKKRKFYSSDYSVLGNL